MSWDDLLDHMVAEIRQKLDLTEAQAWAAVVQHVTARWTAAVERENASNEGDG